jgi:hypothetical protein
MNDSYLFPDAQSNIARLGELRRILAEDADLDSVSDAHEFRAELAALEAWEQDHQRRPDQLFTGPSLHEQIGE